MTERAPERVDERVDVALVGGGGAGLAVLHQLARSPGPWRWDGGPPRPLRVAVVDPLDRLATRPADRTWCSWLPAGSRDERELAPAATRAWDRVVLVRADGRELDLDLAPLRYLMVRSEDWYALVADAVDDATRAGRLDVVHVPAAADGVEEVGGVGAVGGARAVGGAGALVRTPAGDLAASWVLDSRPGPPARAARTALVQHFRGERVRVPAPTLDPERAVLMDFTTPQPPVGLSFGYVLPSDARTALVEYTEFSPAVLDDDSSAAALSAYRARALGGAAGEVEHVEQGSIPMTDAVWPRRTSASVVRIGTAGGAVRPSTGYAFTAMQRQALHVAARLLGGDPPVPPPAYPRRHAWMDALVLRGLADGTLDGPAFFARLFARNPPARVLRFLDGLTAPPAELAVMATAPRATMLRLTGRDAAARLSGAVRP